MIGSHRNSEMKNNEQNDKLSLSELVKRLREQAESLPDDDTEDDDVEAEAEAEEAPLTDEVGEEKNENVVMRYRFRVTKRSRSSLAKKEEESKPTEVTDAITAEVPVAPIRIEPISADGAAIDSIAKTEETNESDDGDVIADSPVEDAETEALEAEIEDSEMLFEESEELEEEDLEGSTLEFDAVHGEVDSDALMKQYLSKEEYEQVAKPRDLSVLEELIAEEEAQGPYLPHGAEAQLQDTGDITYVYNDTDGTEQEPDEELVPPEVDETDVNLMIAFGMDDELAKAIGEGRREQVEQELSDIEKQLRKEEDKNAFEYTSAAQNKQIFKKYKKSYRRVTIKIAICAVLLLIAFLYENISAFGGELADAIHPQIYPVTHIMVDLQIVLFGCALIWRRLKDGAVSLLRLKPSPDSAIFLLALVTVGYDVSMCFLPYGADLYVYGFPMLFGVMCALVFELYNLKREIFSFNIVASKRIKFTIGRLEANRAELEQEAFREYLPDDPSIFKLNKASFVDGFYAKMKPSGSNRRILMVLITFTLALSAALALLGIVWTDNLIQGITIGYITLMMCMPMALYLTYSLPLYRASQIAYEQDSAILGESAIDEYAEASSISFDDRDVFPSYGVKVRSIKVFGNHRIDNIIYHAASVFRIAGGPLSDVFDIATADLGHSEDVRLLSVDGDGIEAVVSGTHLYFGKDEYLRRNHIAPLVDDDDGQVGNASIMYMVSDDEVVAKMYIQYRIDPDFEKTLKQLYRYGICVGIKTLDPNIDDEMLSRRIKLDKYPVRILKCREAEDNTKVLEHTESSLVSKHSAKALLKAFTLCAKVQRMIRTDVSINMISMLVGVIVMLLALTFNVVGQIPSVYVALYQLFWAVPMYLLAKMMIQ